MSEIPDQALFLSPEHNQPAGPDPENPTDSAHSAAADFADLGLPESLLDAIAQLGFTEPTAIQAAAIPALLAGEDVVGVAQTGTGKTAAFGLPLLASLDPAERHPQGLVLAPTRELAMQVAGAIEDFAAEMPKVHVATIYGGAPFYPQKRALDAGAQIVVGTPGRVIDHLERGTLDLGEVGFVVLDEGDEMLRMGFAEDVERILSEVPPQHQTALFSATMPAEIRHTVHTHLRNPHRISVTPQSSTVAGVEQLYAVVPFRHKIGALARVLGTSEAEAALVFVRTKASAEEVGAALVERGVSASVISGDVPQAEREKIIERLRSGQLNVLVATDVAARGLDVDRIGLVVNFDIPREAEDYVHRIGRTGRAGRTGIAFSFITPKERDRIRRIEKATHATVAETPIPTPAEVTAHRVAKLLEQVPERLAKGHLQIVRRAVEEFLASAVEFSGSLDRVEDIASGTAGYGRALVNGHVASTEYNTASAVAETAGNAGADAWNAVGSASGMVIGDAEDGGAEALNSARLQQAVDLAAALAALAVGDRGPSAQDDDQLDVELAQLARQDQRERTSRERSSHRLADGSERPKAARGRDSRREGRQGYGGATRYWVGVGHRDRVKPGAIVGAITNEGGLRGRDLGRIEMFANFSLVEITPELSRQTLRRLAQARVAGRALGLRPDGGQPSRRSSQGGFR